MTPAGVGGSVRPVQRFNLQCWPRGEVPASGPACRQRRTGALPGRVAGAFALLLAGLIPCGCRTAKAPAPPPNTQATIELADGTRVVGCISPDPLKFRSDLLGELSLPVASLRSLEWKAGQPEAHVQALNGDEFTAQLTTTKLRVKTRFGEARLPAATLRKVQVSVGGSALGPKHGLVALWSAEGNARDSVAGHNGEVLNGTVFARGKVGQAFCFATDDGRVYVPEAAGGQLKGSFTVAGWVRVTTYPNEGGAGAIFHRGDDRPGLDTFGLSTAPDGQVQFMIADAEGASTSVSAPAPTGEWFHLAASYDAKAGRLALYVNGQLAGAAQTVLEPLWKLEPSYDASLCLGNVAGRQHRFPFRGLLDEWALYTVALSQPAIQGLVDMGNAGERLLPPPPARAK